MDRSYVIRGGIEGRERLRLLDTVFGPSTRALLEKVGVPAGASCLDVGCGGGDVTVELARLTGATGQVVAVDRDESIVRLARQEAMQQGLATIRFEVGDVNERLPNGPFDLVYARFLLSHLADPQRLVASIYQRLRPGGLLVVEDLDFRGHFAEPPSSALDRYVQLYTRSVQARGGDPHLGPRLPQLLRDSGFDEVRLALEHPAALEGGVKLLSVVTLENIADSVLADGLVTEEALHDLIDDFYAIARDPHTVVGGPRLFQVWGRKQPRDRST